MSIHRLLLPAPSDSSLGLVLLQGNIILNGYQLYAVEKWFVERTRPINLLVVYTGDSEHTVSLDLFVPPDDHVWQRALSVLRADGAKPRQTQHGILMATSLAHFRSDYNIVHVPSGNFLSVRDQLYSNINLLRMGCSGRTALTLEDPSDSTKDRFIAAYHIPDVSLFDPAPPSPPLSPVRSNSSRAVRPSGSWKDRGPNHSTSSLPTKVLGKTKDRSTFVTTVLELVKLIQAALSLFGLYTSPIDGLLCDPTVDAIRSWVANYGEPFADLEPSERIADPMFVSALFSLVLSLRNKLVHLGFTHVLPRDPFLYPYAFTLALTTYLQSTTPPPPPISSSSHHTLSLTLTAPSLSMAHLSHYSIPTSMPIPISAVTGSSGSTSSALPIGANLTVELVENINAAYDKSKPDHNRHKVRRVLKNRLAPLDHHHLHNHKSGESDGADGEPSRRLNKNNLSLSLTRSGGSEITSERSAILQDSLNSSGGGSGGGGIGSSGGQLFTGIGSLASGLRLAAGGGPASKSNQTSTPSDILSPTIDLASFVRVIICGGRSHLKHRDGGTNRRESADFALGGGSISREKEKDGIVAGSLVALWTGRVGDIVRMRELELAVASVAAAAANVGDGHSSRSLVGSERGSTRQHQQRLGLPMSDDELERRGRGRGKGRYDGGKSTEDESDNTHLGGMGMFGGKVRGKLGSWANIGRRKHQSVDFTGGGSPKVGQKEQLGRLLIPSSGRPAMTRRSTAAGGSRAQSPTLPPFNADGEDEEPLSSGQVSPLSDSRPNPFHAAFGRLTTPKRDSNHSLGLNPQDLDSTETFTKLLTRKKKPWAHRRLSQSTRVSSWADPLSAREGLDSGGGGGDSGAELSGSESKRQQKKRKLKEDETELDSDVSGGPSSLLNHGSKDTKDKEGASPARSGPSFDSLGAKWKRREKARFHSLLSVVDGDGFLAEEPLEEEEEDDYIDEDEEDEDEDEEGGERKRWGSGPRRRWSFGTIEQVREWDMDVLQLDRMKLDVSLCGQLLIMLRREEQARNMIKCMKILVNSIENTNALVRDHYETHFEPLTEIEGRSRILLDMDEEHLKANRTSQATNTLRYEAEQFHIPDLWHTVSQSRQKVLSMRDKVFGMGGRRLPAGVHGAHGGFNRLQWSVDGSNQLVDHLGRTESEEEEESRVDPGAMFIGKEGEDGGEDEDVVEHPGIKPMWLLRFFTGWSTRWSAVVAAPAPSASTSAGATNADGATSPKEKVEGQVSPVQSAKSEDVDMASPVSYKTAHSGQSRSPPPIIIPSS